MSHNFREKILTAREIADLKCLDYGERPIHSLSYGSIRRQNESLVHGQELFNDFKSGIREPIVVFVGNGAQYLADGHHRAVYAYENSLSLRAIIFMCDCDNEGQPCKYAYLPESSRSI